MKKLLLCALLAVLFCSMPALADGNVDAAPDTTNETAHIDATDLRVDPSEEIVLIGEFDVTEIASGRCGCVDLCRTDFICVLLYGAGSQCEPMGSCRCKQCILPF